MVAPELELVISFSYLSSLIACRDHVSFSTKIAFVSSYPDYARRLREMRSGRIAKPERSVCIFQKVKWTGRVDLSTVD